MNIVPEWFKKTSIYQINPRTFSPEGTIKAVTKELPVLAKLGFGVMYLCPIFKEDTSENKENWSKRQLASQTENPKNPYRMDDYFEVDSEYGTMDDLREFTKEAHRLGMRVILDLVYLHIGPNADILKTHPEFAERNEDGNIKCTEWNFPYLNYENEGLREYLWCNMTYYIGVIGVDGFRCDVGDGVPLDFWSEGKRRIRAINPDVVMINEGVKSEYLEVFDANYGFYWHQLIYDLLHGSITAADLLAKYNDFSERYKGAPVLRDMDNHDTVTDWPYRIEEHFGSHCMELILAINYIIDGVPMVYCGNELADKAMLNMFANRFHMGKFEVTDRNAKGDAVDRRKKIVKLLNELKSTNATLQNGKTEWPESNADHILAFSRISDDQKLTFIGNFSDKEVKTDIDIKGKMLLSNNADMTDGMLNLSKYGYVIVREG